MISLDTNIINISRVGQATAKKLSKIGITAVCDLLFYFPYRYDDFRQVVPINKLLAGTSANIVGRIEMIQNRRAHRKRMFITEALVSDSTDSVKIIWFNQPFIAKTLKTGDRVSLAGKIEGSKYEKTVISPVYEKITGYNAIHTRRLVPNYHLTANITQKQIRFLIGQVIGMASQLTDWLPADIKKEQGLLNLSEAIKKIHFPRDFKEIDKAKERLAFDELFLMRMKSLVIKKEMESARAEKLAFFEKETRKFVASLPFKLTDPQRRAAWEILQDLRRDKPMTRLLEGDVGSGKTLVALIAMLNSALNKKQSALMAPTEILAKQHFNTVSKLLADFNVRVGLVTASEKKLNYKLPIMDNEPTKRIKKVISNAKFIINNSDIVIGTHALIQEGIHFNNLALAIIDEQHRFGVEQRSKLINQKTESNPHLLSLTATPIPRSLALTLYGELDLSIINQLPKGRRRIITKIVPEENREKAYGFIRDQIKAGRQVFVICPLIDISDKTGAKSVKQEFLKLDKYVFPDIKIGMLHGKMKAKAKEKIMDLFLANDIKILVSTSVVEVGVDVPNASVMMIEGAERFGLAQLHQFRGRVGRSEHQSYCFLFTSRDALDASIENNTPLPRRDAHRARLASDATLPLEKAGAPETRLYNDVTLERLKTMETCFDGFALAKMDLKFRGPGEVFGTAQKGFPELKIASLFDYALIKRANETAKKIMAADPSLNKFPLLKNELVKTEKDVHLE